MGQKVSGSIINELDNLNEYLYGNTVLQIGCCGTNDFLTHLHFSHKWIMSPFLVNNHHSIISNMHSIPLDKHSLDCVIAPLSLELLDDVNHTLFELDRVLKPQGYLVIVGINPWSFWGASVRTGYPFELSHAVTKLYSSLSLKRILFNHDYQQFSHSNFYYLPPLTHHSILNKLELFNLIGKMLWPFPSGFYCLVMQKHIPCQTGLSQAIKEGSLQVEKTEAPVGG